MEYCRFVFDEELYHHGVRGQRHGHRQYQYEDGSLTPLGRIHYGVGQARTAASDAISKTVGVQRYQNKDGTLTAAGQKRYDAAIAANNRKKRKDRAEESSLKDPHGWVKDDMRKASKFANDASKATGSLKNLINKIPDKKQAPRKRLDLSKMSDKELRERINRELLERQYNDVFNPQSPKVNKGKERVNDILDIGGGILSAGSTALALALTIKELRGH